jgi:hypothetical protein
MIIFGTSSKTSLGQWNGATPPKKSHVKPIAHSAASRTWEISATWSACYSSSIWFHNSATNSWKLMMASQQIHRRLPTVIKSTKLTTISCTSFRNSSSSLKHQKRRTSTPLSSVTLIRTSKVSQRIQLFSAMHKSS